MCHQLCHPQGTGKNFQSHVLPFKPQQLIKDKLLLSLYSQLCVVQYGEIGRWSLTWVKVKLNYQFSQHSSYTLFKHRLGELRSSFLGTQFPKHNISNLVIKLTIENKSKAKPEKRCQNLISDLYNFIISAQVYTCQLLANNKKEFCGISNINIY